jgi:hypothetical protein
MEVKIEKAYAVEDAPLLYDDLREADMMECIGLMFHPRDAVYGSFESSSKCYSVKTDQDGLLACFGVSPRENIGVCWLLGTRNFYKVKKKFVKESQMWVDDLMDGFDYLTNYIMEANTLSMRWLKWLGASFEDCNIPGYKSFKIERK